jgi:hypothetical protein
VAGFNWVLFFCALQASVRIVHAQIFSCDGSQYLWASVR